MVSNVSDRVRERCQRHSLGHSDAAKRLSDGYQTRWSMVNPDEILRGRWLAIRLSDGNIDRTIYETRRDAVRFQSDEFLCAYLKLTLLPVMPVCEAEIYLKFHRDAYDNGFRLPDPDHKDGGRELIRPIGTSERLIQASGFRRTRSGR